VADLGRRRILDVGSGLDQLSRPMARATGVCVVGIERSAEQIAEAQRRSSAADETAGGVPAGRRCNFRCGTRNGARSTSLTRFLLERSRPLAVVRAMARAVPADASCWKTTITTG
jgi:hypothetical protein